MNEAVIVEGVRTAVGKSKRGATRNTRPEDMMACVIQELMRRTEGAVKPEDIEDVIVGCAMPEGVQGLNIARQVALLSGLPDSVPGQTVNRFCSSGLQTIATAAYRIMAGFADVIIAGGAESMSLVPMTGNRYAPDPYLAKHYPAVYISMGNSAENLVQAYSVSREEQDGFALQSHL